MLLDFTFSQKEKNVALKKTKELFYNDVLPELNQTFDAAAGYLYIDKLEIEIGETTATDFAEKFSAALKEAMQKLTSESAQQHLQHPATSELINKKELVVADVIFFLEYGYWQWSIQHKDEEEVIKLVEQFLQNNQLMFVLFDKIKTGNAIVLKRFTNLFTLNKISAKQLFFALTEYHSYLKSIESFIAEIYKKVLAGDEDLYKGFIHKLFKSKRLETFADFKSFIVEFIDGYFSKAKKISTARLIFLNKLNDLLNTDLFDAKEILPLLEKILSAKNISLNDAVTNENPDVIPFFKNEEKVKISIDNAGLVLLHPYLPFLFKELKLVDETNNFIDVAAQQKAILFLQVLINKKRIQQEHLLVLNKILCGYPVHIPVKVKHQFTAEELKAGEEMLDALIEHWSILKNTSRKGLVESFIKRKGLIEKTRDGFVVQVEKTSIDILLDSLPFGIRTIKLPWNEYIIYTEWSY